MQFQTRLLLRSRLCVGMILLALTFNSAMARAEKLIYPNSSIEMYGGFSDMKSRQLGKELRLACTSVKDVLFPKLPTLQQQRLRSKNACSEAKNMYYDLLADRGDAAKSADWLKVHACAVAEQDHYVLMMLYANGYGVKPNISVALKYACTTTWSASELAGRVQFFAEAISNGSNQSGTARGMFVINAKESVRSKHRLRTVISQAQPKQKFTLNELVILCNQSASIPPDLIDWQNMPAVGNELPNKPLTGTNCASI